MKRKTLTKKSLEELAQVMPVLSEKEQDELVGGTVYFSKSGNEITFLGEINDSKQGICFVNSPNDYDKALKKSNTYDRDSYLSSHSQSAQKMISGGDLTDNDIPKLVQSLLYGIKGSGATVTFIWERVTYSIQQDSQYYNNSSSFYKDHEYGVGFDEASQEYDKMLKRQSSENRQKIQNIVDPYIYGYYNK